MRTAEHLTVRDVNGQIDKAQTYELHASHWKAEGNEAEEKGNAKRAEKCWEKAQFWLDKANDARGWGE